MIILLLTVNDLRNSSLAHPSPQPTLPHAHFGPPSPGPPPPPPPRDPPPPRSPIGVLLGLHHTALGPSRWTSNFASWRLFGGNGYRNGWRAASLPEGLAGVGKHFAVAIPLTQRLHHDGQKAGSCSVCNARSPSRATVVLTLGAWFVSPVMSLPNLRLSVVTVLVLQSWTFHDLSQNHAVAIQSTLNKRRACTTATVGTWYPSAWSCLSAGD